jgi:hypothetical protein
VPAQPRCHRGYIPGDALHGVDASLTDTGRMRLLPRARRRRAQDAGCEARPNPGTVVTSIGGRLAGTAIPGSDEYAPIGDPVPVNRESRRRPRTLYAGSPRRCS